VRIRLRRIDVAPPDPPSVALAAQLENARWLRVVQEDEIVLLREELGIPA
jgi:hypothetical protein